MKTDYGDYVLGSCKIVAERGLRVESSGYTVTETVVPGYKDQREVSVKLYYADTTMKKTYVDDECHLIGSIVIPIDKDTGKVRKIQVSVVFGLPELEFTVKNMDNGEFIDALFQFDDQ
jgi:hypothetical protein